MLIFSVNQYIEFPREMFWFTELFFKESKIKLRKPTENKIQLCMFLLLMYAIHLNRDLIYPPPLSLLKKVWFIITSFVP